jgi:hypothetical protein
MAVTRRASNEKELTRESIDALERQFPALKALNDETLDKPRGFVLAMAEAIRLTGGDEKAHKKAIKLWKECVLWLRGITVVYDHKNRGYRFTSVTEMLIDRQQRLSKSQEEKHRIESVRLAVIRDPDFSSDHERRMRLLLKQQHDDNRGRLNAQREHARIAYATPETLPRIVGGNGSS